MWIHSMSPSQTNKSRCSFFRNAVKRILKIENIWDWRCRISHPHRHRFNGNETKDNIRVTKSLLFLPCFALKFSLFLFEAWWYETILIIIKRNKMYSVFKIQVKPNLFKINPFDANDLSLGDEPIYVYCILTFKIVYSAVNAGEELFGTTLAIQMNYYYEKSTSINCSIRCVGRR